MKIKHSDYHLRHNAVIIKGDFGPHKAKIHCTDCDKFISWCHIDAAKWFDKTHNKPISLFTLIRNKPR